MVVELETKTRRRIAEETLELGLFEKNAFLDEEFVSLDSHNAAMKELERDKQIAFEAGRK